jgi:signal transduction histidine kinase
MAGNLLSNQMSCPWPGMFRFLSTHFRKFAFVQPLVLLFAISWVDLSVGHEVSLVLFYSAPIVLAVWLCDNKGGFIIAGFAGVLWSWADITSGRSYSSPTVHAWEIAVRFGFFFLVALAGIAIREQHRASTARIALLEHTRKLEKQIIEVSEYEQQRIGRDLHDGLCQFLAAIGCAVTSLKMDLEQRGLANSAATAAEIERLLGESVKQARDLAHGLVPVRLDEGGLPAALQELAASTNRLFPLECAFEFAGETSLPQNGQATHLYRIAQEAIHNATKHSRPSRIDIRLSANRSAMSLSVADDGIGFSNISKQMNGVGISIMRYRANLLGGEFEIEQRASGGTIVSCTVPTNAYEG